MAANVLGIPGVPEGGTSRPQACPAPFTYGYLSLPAPARRAPKGCAAAGHAFVSRRGTRLGSDCLGIQSTTSTFVEKRNR